MKRAFTLIELIATIVILGVVTSVVSILIMNVIRNVKDSANKRSIDNYGRIVETSMAEYQSQYLKYPDSIEQLEIEYVGSVIECETRRINPDKTIYLSECKVNGKKVLDKNTEDGYYHYGTLVLTNEEYIDKLGKNIEVALKDYYKENNKYPVNYRLLDLPKLDKDVNCVSEIHQDGTVYLTKCSIDGIYILNDNEEDGYYHYGNESIYDYVDNEGNGYIKIDYLESTGTQYIDTGYKPNSKTSIEMDLEYIDAISSSSYVFIAGARNEVDSNAYIFAVNKNDYSLRFEYQTYTNYAIYENFRNKGIIKTKNNTIEYASIQKELNASEFSCDYNLYLFDANLGGTPSNRGTKMRLYESKIYEDNILVRDYIPVIDKKSKPCLYDTVNKKCYYNVGTEEFKYFGKSDKTYSYLESTGTQYIDTGYRPNSKTSIEMDLEFLDAVSPSSTTPYVFIAGARNEADYNAYIFAVNRTDYSLRFEYQTYTNYAVYENFRNKGTIKTKNNTIEYASIQKELNASEFSCDYNLYLYDANLGGTPSNRGTRMRLYRVRIYEDNIIVRDYVPNIDSNNELCLYDKVEKKCYYNQGTGEFLYGLIRNEN